MTLKGFAKSCGIISGGKKKEREAHKNAIIYSDLLSSLSCKFLSLTLHKLTSGVLTLP